jgi:hypothetical protein
MDGFDVRASVFVAAAEYRMDFKESKDEGLNVHFYAFEENGLQHMANHKYVRLNGEILKLSDLLLQHPEYIKTVLKMREVFIHWISILPETRLNFLLNPNQWVIFRELDLYLKQIAILEG